MDIRLWARRVVTPGVIAAIGFGLPACTGPKVALVKPTACADFSFPVYFEQKSAELSTGAVQVIAASVARAKSCPVAGLAISGLGDDTGLAAQRAAAVAKALAADGLASPTPVVQPNQPNHGLALLRHSSQVSVHFVATP
jgi:outer membrane protein OmpA-like peptidoglycan-associated protein